MRRIYPVAYVLDFGICDHSARAQKCFCSFHSFNKSLSLLGLLAIRAKMVCRLSAYLLNSCSSLQELRLPIIPFSRLKSAVVDPLFFHNFESSDWKIRLPPFSYCSNLG